MTNIVISNSVTNGYKQVTFVFFLRAVSKDWLDIVAFQCWQEWLNEITYIYRLGMKGHLVQTHSEDSIERKHGFYNTEKNLCNPLCIDIIVRNHLLSPSLRL